LTIARFITEIVEKEEDIRLRDKSHLPAMQTGHGHMLIDGTKQETRLNKYDFVWKPLIYHRKLCDKVRGFLHTMGISGCIPEKGVFVSDTVRTNQMIKQKPAK